MRRLAGALLVGLVVLAGCGGGDDDSKGNDPVPDRNAQAKTAEEKAIRGWILVLNAGNYDQAADYFAPGALIEQGRLARLRTHREAVAFNSSLPCKAEVTDIEDEGETVLAAFKLRRGPGDPASCGGNGVRVRFKFRGTKFTEWRQLPESSDPAGQSA